MKSAIFFGSGSVAVPNLQRLADSNLVKIDLVVTQPPRPTGRKHILTPTPIATLAEQLGLPLTTELNQLPSANIGIVVDYGRILPPAVLAHFPLGIINIHPSLLPRWRGPAPVPYTLLAGDTETGVTLMQLDTGVDTGPIITYLTEPVLPTDTAETLEARLAGIGADLLVRTLPHYLAGTLTLKPQSDINATLSRRLHRDTGCLTAELSRDEIIQRWRALQPWPGVYYRWNDQRLKLIDFDLSTTPATLQTVQLAGKKPITLNEFLRGHSNFPLPQLL